MKVIRVHEFGDPGVLSYEEAPLPEPAAGQVRVRVRAAGVNYIDNYQRSGLYKMALPFTPGQEAVGVVDAVGEGVDFAVGDRVSTSPAARAWSWWRSRSCRVLMRSMWSFLRKSSSA